MVCDTKGRLRFGRLTCTCVYLSVCMILRVVRGFRVLVMHGVKAQQGLRIKAPVVCGLVAKHRVCEFGPHRGCR